MEQRFALSQNERLQYIDTAIREKGIVTVQEVASKFEVTPRTVKRDIEYLRERMNAPIQYIPHKKGYCYSLPFDYFTYRDERMLLFYVFLMKLMNSPTHFPFVDKSISDIIRRSILPQFLPLISKITYEIDEWEELDMTLFSKLFSVLRNDYVVTIHYSDAQGKLTTRTIAPEHFIHYEGRWYVIAYDEDKKGIRTFLLSRIIQTEHTNKKRSKHLTANEIQEFIKSTYGIYKGKTGQIVCVRFYEPVCNIVRKQIWHNKQQIKEGSHVQYGYYIELQLPVHHPQELLGKVLRYGKYAEVISPKGIRKQWLDAIEEAYKRYCEKQ